MLTTAIAIGVLAQPSGAVARDASADPEPAGDSPVQGAVPMTLAPAHPGVAPLEDLGPDRPDTSFSIAAKPDYGTTDNRFGNNRGSHIHEGQDIMNPAGTPILAVRDAEVLEVGTDGGRGNYIYIYSSGADETYGYFHMSEPATVKQGQTVKAGDRLGAVGCTGSCYGDHLHFEVHQGKDAYEGAIDPMPLLRKLEG